MTQKQCTVIILSKSLEGVYVVCSINMVVPEIETPPLNQYFKLIKYILFDKLIMSSIYNSQEAT